MSADARAEAAPGRRVAGVALRTVELVAGYNASPVLHGVSISVQPGKVVSIVGANGSGKSTLLKGIVGLVEIFSGSVLIGDREVTGWPADAVARIGVGYVPQVDDVFAPLTVRENLEMGGYLLRARELPARIAHVLEVFPQLGRMLSRRAGKLSGGERKMLAMGRALMLEPALVVLDEPTANLAPAIARAVLTSTSRSSPRPAPPCSSSSSAPARCSRSLTAPTSSRAGSCGWRAHPPSSPRAGLRRLVPRRHALGAARG